MALVARNLDTGVVVADRIDVADTRATRAVGLLSRDGLEAGEGLWIVPSRGVHTCWMRFADRAEPRRAHVLDAVCD
jgi:uncharacterized protein